MNKPSLLFLSWRLYLWYLLSYRMKGKFETSGDWKNLILCSFILGKAKGRMIWLKSLFDICMIGWDTRDGGVCLFVYNLYFLKILLKSCITLEQGSRNLPFSVFNFRLIAFIFIEFLASWIAWLCYFHPKLVFQEQSFIQYWNANYSWLINMTNQTSIVSCFQKYLRK